jgi:acyl carrier protein
MSDESGSETVERRCIAIIARSKLLPEEAVTAQKSFEELEIDSLDKINISFDIEDAFQIQIPDDDISGLKTVGDVVAGVVRLQRQAEAVSTPSTH